MEQQFTAQQIAMWQAMEEVDMTSLLSLMYPPEGQEDPALPSPALRGVFRHLSDSALVDYLEQEPA